MPPPSVPSFSLSNSLPNWKLVVHSEIVNVIGALRRNQRWSITYGRRRDYKGISPSTYNYCQDYGESNDDVDPTLSHIVQCTLTGSMGAGVSQENMLIQRFTALKARIGLLQNLSDLDPLKLIEPFLDIIKSGEVTGSSPAQH